MLEVQPDLITVLADTAIRAHDLDEAKALDAKNALKKLWQIAKLKWTTQWLKANWLRQLHSCKRFSACATYALIVQ